MLDYSYNKDIALSITSPVDSLQLTDCLKAITWGTQAHETGTMQIYEGSLSIALSSAAEARGLTIDSFSQQLRPSLWLPGTAVLSLSLNGVVLKFRIAEWRFDRQNKTGQARVTQQLALYNRSIPEADLAFPGGYETLVGSLVYKAADVTNNWANDKITVGSVLPYQFARDSSIVYGQVPANNLWSDSQSLLTHCWGWLNQSLQDEKVNATHLDYDTAPLLLSRAGSQAQVQAEQTLSFVAPRVVAYGSADLPDTTACKPDANAAANGYPTNNYTSTYQELGLLMPDDYPKVTLTVESESKYVQYFYRTPGTTRITSGPAGLTSQVLSWEPADKYPMNEQSQLWKTITQTSKVLGVVMPEKYKGLLTLATVEQVTETYTERITEKPYGLIDPVNLPGILTLTEFKREKLNTPPTDKDKCGRDATGAHVATDYVKPEGVKPIQKPLKTQTFRSETTLVPSYRPALDYPYLFDIGWCPSLSFADLVARRVLVREKSRSTTDQVQLPLPNELVVAYCPVFWRAVVRDRLYFADQVQYQITVGSKGEVRAGVSFTGCLLGLVTAVPEPAAPALFFGSTDAAAVELLTYLDLYVFTGTQIAG